MSVAGLALKWGNKVQNVSESVYTMAMDVCETAGKDREIINLFRIMLSRGVPAKARTCSRCALVHEARIFGKRCWCCVKQKR